MAVGKFRDLPEATRSLTVLCDAWLFTASKPHFTASALNCRTNFSRAAFFTMTRMHSTKELEPLTKTLEPKCNCKSVAAWFFLATL